MMLFRRALTTALRSTRPALPASYAAPRPRFASDNTSPTTHPVDPTVEMDPEMNGGYINPPAIRRQHRDPYGDWTDKQERRNYGEPVHEDNDILGIFSLEDYRHMSHSRGLLLWGGFISCVLAVYYGVYATLPDRPSAPKEYVDGLEAELGGPGAVRAHRSGDEVTLDTRR